MNEKFILAAHVVLSRRLKNLLRIDENVEIDMSYITCAEYQLFINEMRTLGKNRQPDHWKTNRFQPKYAKEPIIGVRGSDAEEFCEWLSQKSFSLGVKYRLPTVAEVQTYPVPNPVPKQYLDAWSKDGEKLIISRLKDNQEQSFKNFLEHFLRRFSFACEIVAKIDLATALVDQLNFDVNRAISWELRLFRELFRTQLKLKNWRESTALIQENITFLQENITIIQKIKNDGNEVLWWEEALLKYYTSTKIDLQKSVLQLYYKYSQKNNSSQIVSYENVDLVPSVNLELLSSHSHELNNILHINFLNNTNNLFNSIFARNIDNENKLAKFSVYSLIIYILWNWLSSIYEAASHKEENLAKTLKLSATKCQNLSLNTMKKAEEAWALYILSILIEKRREGQMSAWEGIRIVRERQIK